MNNDETTKASDRCRQSLAALADTPEEVEACADKVLCDIAKLDAQGATMAEHDWDGFS